MSMRVFLGCTISIFVMLSCTNKPTQINKVKTEQPVVNQTKTFKDSRYYLDLAQTSFTANQDTFQRNQLLLKAAQMFQTEQQYSQSIKLIQVLLPELQDKQQLGQAYLDMAESYLAISDKNISVVAKILQHVDAQLVDSNQLSLLQYKVLVDQKNWLSAADILLNTQLSPEQKSQNIWQAISHLSTKELEEARWQNPTLLPWIQLTLITRHYALTPTELSKQVVAWQSANVGHPLQENLPLNLIQALEQKPIIAKRIAVLLPLSGRLASQGQVLKDGFLTAYLNQKTNTTEVQFIDSALKTAPELNELVTDYDVVVGPLIKEKIQALSEILPTEKILLALNRVDTLNQVGTLNVEQVESLSQPSPTGDNKEHYYFSLAPEDEAQQLARLIHKKQLFRPILFADDNSITKRMAQAFIQEWHKVPTANKPELTIFKDIKEMRTSVATMLDVEQSKARIRQIERLANVEVFGKERNRRDIDAIVLFANPEQTGLLNPIIEASLSSFAEVSLSVFASSRSYSQNQTTGSLRDLRNLTFSDMPWLLPDHPWQDLQSQTTLLWPHRQDSLARLFAMGYDSYNLIPHLRQMKNLPQVTKQGLTGQVNLEQSGIIRRHLPMAKISMEKVTLLEMD